jgi:hypothetical protein
VGVVLRNQNEIENEKTINDKVTEETNFFENNNIYRKLKGNIGSSFLLKTVQNILLELIRYHLPEYKYNIEMLIQQKSGFEHDDNISEGEIFSLLNKYSQNYIDLIDGKVWNQKNELFGGSRINYIFKQFPIDLYNLNENLSEEEIKLAIRNSKGTKSFLFIPESAFDNLLKSQIKLLLSPSLQCCDLVFDELIKIIDFVGKVKKQNL